MSVQSSAMSLPRDRLARGVGGRPASALLDKEKAATKARDRAQHRAARAADGRGHQGLRLRGPGRHRVAARPVRGSPAADRVPLHVPPGLGRRLPELHRRHRRDLARVPRAPAHAGHDLRPGVAGAARQARALEGEAGLGPHPLVLHQRRRLQLRLRRHHRRVTRLRRVQLPHARRVRRHGRGEHAGLASSPTTCPAAPASSRSTAASSAPTPCTPGASRRTGGSYYFLDLTALGRQEDWEEPKGRSESVRGNQPDFHE